MMFAAIDAGSNTLRLLIGEIVNGKLVPNLYVRRISRLAGGFTEEEGLSCEAKERTTLAFKEFAEVCRNAGVTRVKATGTAAFRQAVNGEAFAESIRSTTGIPLEIISGEREAELMTEGVLSAVDPIPEHALIVDVGGGSTELVLYAYHKVLWARSLQLGVVRLTEECSSSTDLRKTIERSLAHACQEIRDVCSVANVDTKELSLVGTAGTVTTLAALDMAMSEYDWRLVNNYSMSCERLSYWYSTLLPLSPLEREALPGMESGRGDLIISGLEIVLVLMQAMGSSSLVVSDFGILEGILLSMQKSENS